MDASIAKDDARPLLIVTGLPQEARIATGPGVTVICSSSDPNQLRAQLGAFDASKVRGIISFGVAGGLDPALHPGDIVIATEIVAANASWTTSDFFTADMINDARADGRRVVRGILAGAEEVVLNPTDKATLRAETSAIGVDMESHIAAAYAASAGLPFTAVRVISDPASRALPEIAANALKPDGNIDIWKILRGIARRPSVIPDLVRTSRDFNQAIAALRGCRSLLLASSGFLGSRNGLIFADL